MLVVSLGVLTFQLKVGINLLYIIDKLIGITLEALIGDKEVLFHIALFNGITCLTCKNHQLAYHVFTTKVDARVGLTVTFLTSHFDGSADWNATADNIEDEIQCARKHSLDFENLVARVD